MKNTVIYLLGFPGTGKYTIAREICAQDSAIRLVDNHLINNPLFSLIRMDGFTPLHPRIWDNVGRIWEAVLDTMVHISEPDYSFVLTNALSDQGSVDRAWYEEVKNAAAERGSFFIPVRLLCAREEMERRIVMPERAARLKEINPDSPRRNLETRTVLNMDHPYRLDLDVTALSASEAARIILDHARACENTRKD